MCRRLESTPLCEYKSTRYIRVRNPILVISYYTIIFLVLCYVALYTIWIEKGYQKFETVVGTTSVKLKGTASIAANSTNDPINSTTFNGKYIYDAMDLVIPSMEENAFFIATSMISTINQKRGKCSLDSKDLVLNIIQIFVHLHIKIFCIWIKNNINNRPHARQTVHAQQANTTMIPKE